MSNRWQAQRANLIGALHARVQLVAVAGLVAVLAGVGTVGLTASAQAMRRSATRLVPGYLAGLSRATFVKSAPSDLRMTIGVGVQLPHAAAEHALYEQMYNSSSPEYHHFLTPAQFDRRFGASTATVASVRSFLRSTGATITSASKSGGYFMISATVAQAEKLFKVKIGDYTYKGLHFFANSAPPSVPASLPVLGVLGLNSEAKMSLASLTGHQLAAAKSAEASVAEGRKLIAAHAAYTRRAQAGSHAALPAQSGTEQEFTPQDLWGIYDDPNASALTNPKTGTSTPATLESSRTALGQGQTIGVFGVGETSSVVDQLRLFEAAEGLPKVPVRTVETEGATDSGYGANFGSIEWYLDSQSSTGMAPDVKQLDFYFSKRFFDADVDDLFSYWAGDPNGPEEMNASFGECEANPLGAVTGPEGTLPVEAAYGYSLEASTEPVLEQAAMEGRTLFTSAGDTGSGCPEVAVPVLGAGNGVVVQPVPDVGYPCASEYAVCVGGTVVSAKGTTYPTASQRVAETSWTYGGGGNSYFIPEPSFQSGVTAITTGCVSTPDGGTVYAPGSGPVCRAVPDVSALSGNVDGDGYFIYSDGAPSSEGGTSLSSPLTMGQWARIQSAGSAAVQRSGGLGFADPLIYKQAAGADACDTGDEDSAESEIGDAPACTDKKYESEFFDITQSEDVGDTAGAEGLGEIDGINGVNTGIGIGNGADYPAPGWDFASGWGALNVANFMQAVTGSTSGTSHYTGTERNAIDATTVSMTSPVGNASDPVTSDNDAGLDITGATLSATPKTITATLTVPDLSDGPPADAEGGASFYVLWSDKGTDYYAQANELADGTFSYSSGSTEEPGIYSDDANTAATGTANTTTGVITISIPASEVGSPPQCSLLTVPQALDQIDVGVPEFDDVGLVTADSADDFKPYASDGGLSESVGANVVVGGTTACGSPNPS